MSDLLDARQRVVAALCLSAMDMPAPAAAWAEQIRQAASICPGLTSNYLHNTRLGALIEARELLNEMIDETRPAPIDAYGPT